MPKNVEDRPMNAEDYEKIMSTPEGKGILGITDMDPNSEDFGRTTDKVVAQEAGESKNKFGIGSGTLDHIEGGVVRDQLGTGPKSGYDGTLAETHAAGVSEKNMFYAQVAKDKKMKELREQIQKGDQAA